MKSPVVKKQDLSWLFLLLLLLGVLVIFFSNETDSRRSSTRNFETSDKNQMEIVNKHLKETAINVQRDQLLRMQDRSRQMDLLKRGGQQSKFENESRFGFDSDKNLQELTESLDRSQELQDQNLSPEQIVQSRLYENQIFQRETEEFREQYAKQFIENARKGGWEITLGPQYEVLSVKKIKPQRTPSQLFEGSSSGSR